MCGPITQVVAVHVDIFLVNVSFLEEGVAERQRIAKNVMPSLFYQGVEG